jgi:hypothetical protein
MLGAIPNAALLRELVNARHTPVFQRYRSRRRLTSSGSSNSTTFRRLHLPQYATMRRI